MKLVEAVAVGTLCLTTALYASRSPAQTTHDAPASDADDEEGTGGQAPEPNDTPEPPADTQLCLAGFSAAQRHRREGKLIEARTELISCSQPSCPEEIVAKCTPWLREVDTAVPSIIPVARDADGRDLVSVRVSIDGSVVTEVLNGMPVELDPGPHVILFEPKRRPSLSLNVVVVQAQKNRMVVAQLTPTEPPPPLPEPAPLPEPDDQNVGGGTSPWAWVGFGIGAVGLVAGTVTGALALAKADELEEICNGTQCTTTNTEPYDEGVRLAHASTGLFIVGGAGVVLGVAALIWLGDDPSATALSFGPAYVGARGRF